MERGIVFLYVGQYVNVPLRSHSCIMLLPFFLSRVQVKKGFPLPYCALKLTVALRTTMIQGGSGLPMITILNM